MQSNNKLEILLNNNTSMEINGSSLNDINDKIIQTELKIRANQNANAQAIKNPNNESRTPRYKAQYQMSNVSIPQILAKPEISEN